jgi:hypothetical protein
MSDYEPAMSELNVSELLALISVIDNRQVTPATVRTWHPLIGHLPFSVAREAMEMHFAESTAYLLPAHILAGARRVHDRRDRMARRAQGAIERKQITLDRAKFEAETQAALEATRAAKIAAVQEALDTQVSGQIGQKEGSQHD